MDDQTRHKQAIDAVTNSLAARYGRHWRGTWRDVIERYLSVIGKSEPVTEALESKNALIEQATVYAERLAVALHARHYPEVTQWQPLHGDLIGLLTQIDNMTSALVRAIEKD